MRERERERERDYHEKDKQTMKEKRNWSVKDEREWIIWHGKIEKNNIFLLGKKIRWDKIEDESEWDCKWWFDDKQKWWNDIESRISKNTW